MPEKDCQLRIDIEPDAAGNEEGNRLARQLRDQIRRGGDVVGFAPETEAREGGAISKSDPLTLSALLVTMMPNMVPKLMDLVIELVKKSRDRRVKITVTRGEAKVEVEFGGAAEQRQIDLTMQKIELFLQRT